MIASILLVSKNAPVTRRLKTKKWAAGPPFEGPDYRSLWDFFAEYNHFPGRRKAQTVGPERAARGRRRKRRKAGRRPARSEEHTSELQSRSDLVCRLLLEKKKKKPLPLLHKNKKKKQKK